MQSGAVHGWLQSCGPRELMRYAPSARHRAPGPHHTGFRRHTGLHSRSVSLLHQKLAAGGVKPSFARFVNILLILRPSVPFRLWAIERGVTDRFAAPGLQGNVRDKSRWCIASDRGCGSMCDIRNGHCRKNAAEQHKKHQGEACPGLRADARHGGMMGRASGGGALRLRNLFLSRGMLGFDDILSATKAIESRWCTLCVDSPGIPPATVGAEQLDIFFQRHDCGFRAKLIDSFASSIKSFPRQSHFIGTPRNDLPLISGLLSEKCSGAVSMRYLGMPTAGAPDARTPAPADFSGPNDLHDPERIARRACFTVSRRRRR